MAKKAEQNDKQTTSKRVIPGRFVMGNPGGPGRVKGSICRTTKLKHAILDGIALAAKQVNFTPAEYIAEMLKDKDQRLGVLKIGAGLVPKELKVEQKVTRMVINVRPDEDCKKGAE